MSIALIDYGMGNLGSVSKALRCCGAGVVPVSSGRELAGFDRCILPGVGNFGDGMSQLRARGFEQALQEFRARGGWLFGICLGMQMLMEESEEAPGVRGLGFFPGAVRRFPASGNFKVPQIGWNTVRFCGGGELSQGMPQETWFYFVHSYYVPLCAETVAEAEYILPFSAIIGRGRVFAAQFHPEKSQQAGLLLLKNFLKTSGELS